MGSPAASDVVSHVSLSDLNDMLSKAKSETTEECMSQATTVVKDQLIAERAEHSKTIGLLADEMKDLRLQIKNQADKIVELAASAAKHEAIAAERAEKVQEVSHS